MASSKISFLPNFLQIPCFLDLGSCVKEPTWILHIAGELHWPGAAGSSPNSAGDDACPSVNRTRGTAQRTHGQTSHSKTLQGRQHINLVPASTESGKSTRDCSLIPVASPAPGQPHGSASSEQQERGPSLFWGTCL